MDKDELVRYLMWIVFFIIVLAGLFITLKKVGILS